MTIESNEKLLQLTRDMLDLKKEKKQYNSDMNERIKEIEADIKKTATQEGK